MGRRYKPGGMAAKGECIQGLCFVFAIRNQLPQFVLIYGLPIHSSWHLARIFPQFFTQPILTPHNSKEISHTIVEKIELFKFPFRLIFITTTYKLLFRPVVIPLHQYTSWFFRWHRCCIYLKLKSNCN